MPTRFYLPFTGTSPLASLADDAGWELVSGSFARLPTYTTKQATAMAYTADANDGSLLDEDKIVRQWTS